MANPALRGDSTLREYLRVVWRGKWIVAATVVVLVALAVAYSLHQQPLYQASSEVLLSNDNLANALSDVQQSGTSQPDRVAATQANLARVPAVAAATVRAARAPESPGAFLAASSVTPKASTDLLEFVVNNQSPALATRLATAYARQYTVYRRQLDTAAIVRALSDVGNRIDQLAAAGDRRSALYANLVEKEQQLRTMQALQTSNASVVRDAGVAIKVRPRTLRNAVLAAVLALVIGISLAFLRDALDTRVRTADEVERLLGIPLLARVPQPSRKLRADNRLVMFAEPNGAHAEAFRMLRTNLDFANMERGARSIMVTSGVEGEGKSTTIANLAIALARSGRRVIVVDLDLRRPMLDTFFRIVERPGLTEVALGQVTLEQALTSIAVSSAESDDATDIGVRQSNGSQPAAIVKVLCSGPKPPNPGEFVSSRALGSILDRLRDSCDVLLIDAPPLLRVGDTMALSSKVDAVFVIARLNVIRRNLLTEIRRFLEAMPSAKLGFCLAAAEAEVGFDQPYGYYAYHELRPEKPRRERRRSRHRARSAE